MIIRRRRIQQIKYTGQFKKKDENLSAIPLFNPLIQSNNLHIRSEIFTIFVEKQSFERKMSSRLVHYLKRNKIELDTRFVDEPKFTKFKYFRV